MKKAVFVIFIVVSALIVVSVWRAQKWEKDFQKKALFELESLGLRPFNLEQLEEPQIQEFTSPDGKLKIRYPGDWLAIKEGEILKALTLETWAQEYNLETLFFANKIRGEAFSQLVIYKGVFGLTIPEIIEEMKKMNQEQGWQMKVVSSTLQEKEGIFEAKYQIPASTSANGVLYSQEKILLSEENKVYLISGVAPKKDWLMLSKEIESIIDSAVLTKP